MIDSLLRLIGLGKINTVKDDGNAQLAQVQLTAAQTRDQSPVLGLFGVISNAPAGSDAVYLAQGGDSSKVLVIATNHQASRFRNAPSGAGGCYDQVGSSLLLSNDGNATLTVSGTFTIKIGTMTAVFSNAGLVVTEGAITSTGDQVAGHGTAGQVTQLGHKHPTAEPGAPSAPTAGT